MQYTTQCTFGHICQLLLTFGLCWRLLSGSGHFCPLLTAFVNCFSPLFFPLWALRHVWLLSTSFERSWLAFWPLLVTFGFHCPMLAISGFFWCFLVTFSQIWLLLATSALLCRFLVTFVHFFTRFRLLCRLSTSFVHLKPLYCILSSLPTWGCFCCFLVFAFATVDWF